MSTPPIPLSRDACRRISCAVREHRPVLLVGFAPHDADCVVRAIHASLGPLPPETRIELESLYARLGDTPPRGRPLRCPSWTTPFADLALYRAQPLCAPFQLEQVVPIAPAEVSLAHGGVLHLCDAERFPIEHILGVCVARGRGVKLSTNVRPYSLTLPSDFSLLMSTRKADCVESLCETVLVHAACVVEVITYEDEQLAMSEAVDLLKGEDSQ